MGRGGVFSLFLWPLLATTSLCILWKSADFEVDVGLFGPYGMLGPRGPK